jgi:hypothetical protein
MTLDESKHSAPGATRLVSAVDSSQLTVDSQNTPQIGLIALIHFDPDPEHPGSEMKSPSCHRGFV